MLLITHYTRILQYVQPDFVHVFVGGKIVEEGGAGAGRGAGVQRLRAVPGGGVAHDRGEGDCPATTPRPAVPTLDTRAIRADFPILGRAVRGGHPLVYLDSGATSQKPRQVLDAEHDFYTMHNSAAHRGAHLLGPGGHRRLRGRPGAGRRLHRRRPRRDRLHQERDRGLNLVAYAMSNAATAGPESARFRVGPGDEILVTEMEHHANLVPWQQLCQRTGATLRWFGVTPDGRLDLTNIDELITDRTRLVAVTHQSNVTGTIPPVTEIAKLRARARRAGGGRRRAVGAAPAGRRRRAGRRLPRLLRAQDARARRASACCGGGASCWRPCRRS